MKLLEANDAGPLFLLGPGFPICEMNGLDVH